MCIDCVKYVGTGLNRQTITSRAATDLASTTLTLNSASVRLNSIGDDGNQVENVMVSQPFYQLQNIEYTNSTIGNSNSG